MSLAYFHCVSTQPAPCAPAAMHSSEYELGNVGEDFGLQPIGEDDEHFNDDETFGDTGPLNIQHNHLILVLASHPPLMYITVTLII